MLDGHWILGQGTIYPDTIESGGTEKAAVIKTHHNRVAGIQQLIEAERIVEPLSVVLQGRSARDRPRAGDSRGVAGASPVSGAGPGDPLPVRGARRRLSPEPPEGWLLPVRSVGVQGDSRSYRRVLALERFPAGKPTCRLTRPR